MIWLRQSTARTIKFGPFLDKTDGVSLEVGLASALDNATTGIRVSKNGGNYADRNSSTAPTYDETGEYNVELDTTDTNTLGVLKIIFEEAATCLPVWEEFMVVPSNVWDSLFGSDLLDVNTAQWLGTACATPTVAGVPEVDVTHLGGGAQSGTDLKDFADAGYDPATNKVQGVVLTDTCTANTDMAGTDSAALASVCTEGRLAELDAANLPTDISTIDTVVDAIKAVTDLLPDAGALTTIGTDTARLTAVRAAVLTDWINGGRLDLILDIIAADVVNLDGAAMRGTDSGATAANLATVDTVVDAIKAVTDLLPDAGALTTIGADTARLTAARAAILTDWIDAGRLDAILDAIKAVTDNLPDSGALTTIGTDTARLTAVRAAVLTDWINDGRLDLLLDAIKAVTDALTAASAANLAASAGQIIKATVDTVVNTHTPTTTEFQADDITEATADHFNGRIVIFTSGVLAGQATDITDYAAVGGIGQFTVTAMTEAPSNNDTFVIV